jgi:uncharacterized Zn finger protein (UPF0148 family)
MICAYCNKTTEAFIPPRYEGYLGNCPNCGHKLRIVKKVDFEKSNDPMEDIRKYKEFRERTIEEAQNKAMCVKLAN